MDQNIVKLPNDVYEDTLKEILQNNLTNSIENYVIKYGAGSRKGDNYMGIVYRIQVITVENDEIVMSLIAKLPPENISRRNLTDVHCCFIKEIKFYDSIYPIYKKFQEERGIDVEKDGFHQVPFCYKTLIEEPNEGLFFEDLKASGFEMFDRFEEVTKDHVFLVMKALAKMHAISYAINDQKPELIESYKSITDHFVKLCERENSSVGMWFEVMKNQALEMIDKRESSSATERVKSIFKNKLYEVLKECICQDNAVLCHGDCWDNNIMFRCDSNGTPIDLRLLDFQIMRFASPVTDLMYYIFCCTTKILRSKHYEEFLDTYYITLSNFMERLGSDPEKVFSRRIFEDHLKKFGKFGLVMATIDLPIFTSDVNDTPDMDEISETLEANEVNEEFDKNIPNFTSTKTYDAYAERMISVCEDMYNLGYI